MSIDVCEFCGRVYQKDELLNCYICGGNVCIECTDYDSKGREICPGCYSDEEDYDE